MQTLLQDQRTAEKFREGSCELERSLRPWHKAYHDLNVLHVNISNTNWWWNLKQICIIAVHLYETMIDTGWLIIVI